MLIQYLYSDQSSVLKYTYREKKNNSDIAASCGATVIMGFHTKFIQNQR